MTVMKRLSDVALTMLLYPSDASTWFLIPIRQIEECSFQIHRP